MDESNHEMVNLLTQHICIIFNPLIHKTNQSYQQLAYYIGRIPNVFSAPQAPIMSVPNNPTLVKKPPLRVVEVNEGQNGLEVVLVQRNLDIGQILKNFQQNDFEGKFNITKVVEQILTQNVGLHMLNYVSPLCRRLNCLGSQKTPKFTKFVGDTNDSIVEYVSISK